MKRADILREAAAYLRSAPWADDGEHRFMCMAVARATYNEFGRYTPRWFLNLLVDHDVFLSGNLDGKPRTDKEGQALRFDFLNLLAESME